MAYSQSTEQPEWNHHRKKAIGFIGLFEPRRKRAQFHNGFILNTSGTFLRTSCTLVTIYKLSYYCKFILQVGFIFSLDWMTIHLHSKLSKFSFFIRLTLLHTKITVHIFVGYCHSLQPLIKLRTQIYSCCPEGSWNIIWSKS